jgi:hypothetical protein
MTAACVHDNAVGVATSHPVGDDLVAHDDGSGGSIGVFPNGVDHPGDFNP